MSADEFGDDDAPEQTVHVADDLDEWLQRQRYQDIFQAKRSASDVLSQAAIGATGRAMDVIQSRQAAAERVTQFLIEIKRVFEETDRGKELYRNEHLATFGLSEVPQLETTDFDTLTTINGLEPIEQDGRYHYRIGGVREFRELTDTRAVIGWEQVANSVTGRVEQDSQRFTPYPPVHVTREVYEKSVDLLGDVGLDLDLEPESDEASWGPDYRGPDSDDE